MSSYIKLVFNYLFHSAEYLSEPPGNSASLQQPQQQLQTVSPGQAASAVQPQQQQLFRASATSWCVTLTRLLALENRTLASSTLRSFADFEALLRQQQHPVNSSWPKPLNSSTYSKQESTPSHSMEYGSGLQLAAQPTANWSALDKGHSFAYLPAHSQAEAVECYNALQLRDYYQSYDILVGLRIASSLTILFIVFILFVIYKTGCRDNGGRPSRSQLQLSRSQHNTTSGAATNSSIATNAIVNNNTSGHINQLA